MKSNLAHWGTQHANKKREEKELYFDYLKVGVLCSFLSKYVLSLEKKYI